MALARIAGVNIPTNKRVLIGLQYIHGIGPAKAREIVNKVAIPDQRRGLQITDQKGPPIPERIDPDHLPEGALRPGPPVDTKRAMGLCIYPRLRPLPGPPGARPPPP